MDEVYEQGSWCLLANGRNLGCFEEVNAESEYKVFSVYY